MDAILFKKLIHLDFLDEKSKIEKCAALVNT